MPYLTVHVHVHLRTRAKTTTTISAPGTHTPSPCAAGVYCTVADHPTRNKYGYEGEGGDQ